MSAAVTPRMRGRAGFTLVEVLTAVAMLSLLGLMSYRGLNAVLEVEARVARETDKWRAVAAFFARFERDVQLAAARPVRAGNAALPAFIARERGGLARSLELSRMSASGTDSPRRVAYSYDGAGSIALSLWPGLDGATDAPHERYLVLGGVSRLELHYLDSDLAWRSTWPAARDSPPLPLAVRVRLVLGGGEDIVRVFALKS